MDSTLSTQKIFVADWTFRVRFPSTMGEKTKILLLLHGHLGNEDVMWILTRPLPDDLVILSPRAPVKFGANQFSWHKINDDWPNIDAYQDILSKLMVGINEWLEQKQFHPHQFDLMGFSQGAVVAYAFSILYPARAGRVAALAGFIPNNWKNSPQISGFEGKQFYIAHGVKDTIIPIEKARRSADWLKEQGAQVSFCEADIGHKLSANCFKGLGEFFS